MKLPKIDQEIVDKVLSLARAYIEARDEIDRERFEFYLYQWLELNDINIKSEDVKLLVDYILDEFSSDSWK